MRKFFSNKKNLSSFFQEVLLFFTKKKKKILIKWKNINRITKNSYFLKFIRNIPHRIIFKRKCIILLCMCIILHICKTNILTKLPETGRLIFIKYYYPIWNLSIISIFRIHETWNSWHIKVFDIEFGVNLL